MKKYRFFVVLFCLASVFFTLANFFVWTLWVEDLRTSKYAGGDLARIGYLSDVRVPRRYLNDLPRRHQDFSDYRGEHVDVLTIGDSFSNCTGLGVNVFYQDHLATKQGLSVLNVNSAFGKKPPQMPFQIALIKLINSNVIDEIEPKYIILEVVERNAIKTLGRELDFNLKATDEDIKYLKGPQERIEKYKPKFFNFISTANAKYVLNIIFYRIKNHNSDKSVYFSNLRKDLFDIDNGKKLVYLGDDIKNIKLVNSDSINRLNDNLNKLSQMLKEKKIKLIFMPAVDKYNLYRDYLVDDSMPRSQFFEMLRPLKKDYLFIDTKAILAEELAKSEKDVYFADDTHWSSKAGAAIFSRIILH